MSTQTLLDPADAGPPLSPRLLLLSSAAALVLVATVALSAWPQPQPVRVVEADDTTAAVLPSAVSDGTAPLIGGLAERYQAQPAERDGPVTVLVVTSPAAADELAAWLQAYEADRTRRVDQVLVAATDADGQQLRQALSEVNRLRDHEGLVPIELVDLRSPATGSRVESP